MSTNKGVPDPGDRWDRTPAKVDRTDAVPDFGSFMRQVFPESRGGDAALGALTPARGQAASLVRRDYETAFTLLQRASEAFPALLGHCQQLEMDMRRLRADAQEQVRTANGETQQWQQIAVAMKMRIEDSEHQLALTRKRLAAAEERLAAGQGMAAAAEQQANIAIGITTLFHDKIIDAFGVGSAAHAALDAAVQGALRAPGVPPRDDN